MLSLGGRRSNPSVAPLRPHHILLVAELSPVIHPLLSASLPFLLSQHSKLLNDLFGLHFFHFTVDRRLLQLGDVVFLLLDVHEDLLAGFVVLLLEGGLRER